jgi:serine/threonine-protein kinase
MQSGSIIAGKYRLRRPLEQGGMASVWVGENIALGIDVAIKLPLTEIVPHSVPRMLREAQLSAQIVHPNIVRVFDFGITKEREPFIVMELLQGETLEDMLARDGRMEPVEAVQLLLPLADALSCAHERGIVHRDLKPANVFLARDSKNRVTPKLLDFGIAKLDRLESVDRPKDRRLTRDGTAVGSPDYMSPEQAEGLNDLDQRTDIWSFCVLAYELVSGSVPFADVPNDNSQLLRAIIERPVRPFAFRAAGAEDLWKILSRGLVKREQRFSNIRDLGVELARWLVDQGIEEDICASSVRTSWLGASARAASQSRQVIRSLAAQLRSRRAVKRILIAAALGVTAIGIDAGLGLDWSAASAVEHNAAEKVMPIVAQSLPDRPRSLAQSLPRSSVPATRVEPMLISVAEAKEPASPSNRRPGIDIWARAKRASAQHTRQ